MTLQVQFSRTDMRRKKFSNRAITLPESTVRATSLDAFKQILRADLDLTKLPCAVPRIHVGRALSSVGVVSTFSNISSETTGPIETKFHMEPPWDWGTKVCANGPGHITKMAVMPIYGKNL